MRKLTILGGIVVVLLLVLAGGAGMRQSVAAPDDVAVSITGTATRTLATYSITISNKGTVALGDIYVAGAIPEGATGAAVVTTPAGAGAIGKQGDVVAWVVRTIPAGGSVTLSYSANGSNLGPAHAFAAWKAPTAGSATSASVSYSTVQEAGLARRGCMACHYSVTLARESLRGGPNHPTIANDADVNVCLGCHKAAADRTGLAPKMLRTIVHSAHMNSESFVTRYKGNCFTCHEVDETGKFKLLYEKVELNQYNVPSKVNSKGYASVAQ